MYRNTDGYEMTPAFAVDATLANDVGAWADVGAVATVDKTGAYVTLKRVMDISGALIGLALLSPIFAAAALAVWMTDKGPIFYRQKRIGRGGREIKVAKFRSMVVDSAALLERFLSQNPDARAEWNATRKLKNDPRITKVGNFLRLSSIDELPQLWNVLVGDMSLIGPRPVVKDELDTYYRSRRVYYYAVRPGITGLWQVSGRNDTTYEQRVQLDCTYVRKLSLWTDVSILLRTLPAVLKSSGAY